MNQSWEEARKTTGNQPQVIRKVLKQGGGVGPAGLPPENEALARDRVSFSSSFSFAHQVDASPGVRLSLEAQGLKFLCC